MLVGQKSKVHREVVIERVKELSGVDMNAITSDADLAKVIAVLEELRLRGLRQE